MSSKSRLGITILLLAGLNGCGSSDTTSKTQAVMREQAAAPRQLAQTGANTVNFSGNRSEYTISASALTVTDNVNGAVQTVPAGARLIFADTAVALDLDGNAGMAYRLYQAAFNRQPDLGGLGYWINALDSGFSLQQVSQDFINSAEFSAAYGSLTDVAFVTQLYANVLRRLPDPGGLAFHVDYIENGPIPAPGLTTRAQDLTDFSESAEDKQLVLPAIQNGMEYTPDGTSPPNNPVSAYAAAYQGSFVGTDAGVLTLTFASNGTLTATGHSVVVGADISGTGMVQAGGKFSFPLSGNGRTMNFSGSINLANGLATGTWTGNNPTDFGVFHSAIVVTSPPPSSPPPPALFTQVQSIVTQRCLPCHSVHPTEAGYSAPPLGITFDSAAQIRSNAAVINANAVESTFMPYMNATGMTTAERNVLAAWFAAGTP